MLVGYIDLVICSLLRQGATLSSLSHEDMLEAKQLGYSDIQISQRMGTTEDEVWYAGKHLLGCSFANLSMSR